MTREYVTIPKEAWDFLCGQGELDGVSFGEPHPTRSGAFWWRSYIAALAPAPAPDDEALIDEFERLTEKATIHDREPDGPDKQAGQRAAKESLRRRFAELRERLSKAEGAYAVVCDGLADKGFVITRLLRDNTALYERLEKAVADKDAAENAQTAAESALAACRDKTIEADDATVLLVAKAIAPTYGDTPEIAWAHLTARGEEGLYLAQARDAIRALKDKEHKHG